MAKRPRPEDKAFSDSDNPAQTGTASTGMFQQNPLLPRFSSEPTSFLFRRPLPSSQALIASVDVTSKKPCPLIEAFYRSLGRSVPEVSEGHPSGEVPDADDTENPQFHILSIEDSLHSTLSEGQHRRYLQLSSSGSWRHSLHERKEFSTLRRLVEKEQNLYRKALDLFWREHSDRLKVGFRKDWLSPFVEHVCSPAIETEAWEHRELSRRFGGVCQVISSPLDVGNNSKIERIQSETIHVEEIECKHVVQELPRTGTAVPPSSSNKSLSKLEPLSKDCLGLRLARQHRVSIFMTKGTLELLFKHSAAPRNLLSSWILPAIRSEKVSRDLLVLEEPSRLSFDSPRECLTMGLNLGMEEWLQGSSEKEGPGSKTVVYILVSLPSGSFRGSTKAIRILVREGNALFYRSSSIPLKIHAHVEYFAERGTTEVAGTVDRVSWLLDCLLQPDARVVLARIAAANGQIKAWEDVSLAHALMMDETIPPVMLPDCESPMETVVSQLVFFLNSLMTLSLGEHVLCFRGRDGSDKMKSITVHRSSPTGSIDIHTVLSQAGQVPLGPVALQSCYRCWTWHEPNRAPYTFPIKKREKK